MSHFSLDRCQPGQDFLHGFPQLVLLFLKIRNVLRIDASGLIGLLRILVQVVAAATEEADQFPDIGEVQVHAVAIQCHLAKISTAVSDPDLLHFLLDPFHLFGCAFHKYSGISSDHNAPHMGKSETRSNF